MAGAGTGPGEEQGGRVGGGSEEGEGGRERRRGGWQGEAKEDGRRTGRVRIMSIFFGGGRGRCSISLSIDMSSLSFSFAECSLSMF